MSTRRLSVSMREEPKKASDGSRVDVLRAEMQCEEGIGIVGHAAQHQRGDLLPLFRWPQTNWTRGSHASLFLLRSRLRCALQKFYSFFWHVSPCDRHNPSVQQVDFFFFPSENLCQQIYGDFSKKKIFFLFTGSFKIPKLWNFFKVTKSLTAQIVNKILNHFENCCCFLLNEGIFEKKMKRIWLM